MKTLVRGTHRAAFSLVELLVIVVLLVLVVGFLIPRFGRVRELAKAEECRKNLQLVGYHYLLRMPDISDIYPTLRFAKDSGTKQLVNSGLVFVELRTGLSNELAPPKVLICPADREKVAAARFAQDFSDTNVSYFVGVDAREAFPASILSGDRNLATNSQRLRPGLFTLSTNSVLTWTSDFHRDRGNIAFGDGSVQFLDQARLLKAVRESGLATNRLAIP